MSQGFLTVFYNSNFLNFGSKAKLVGSSVPFANGNHPFYSVGKQRLPIPEYYSFSKDADHQTNGNTVILDMGNSYSLLLNDSITPLYAELIQQVGPKAYSDDLFCVQRQEEEAIERMPKITFHFHGYDFILRNKGVYVCATSFCCIKFRSSDSYTNVIGISLQVNYNIGYDIAARKLYFKELDCLNLGD